MRDLESLASSLNVVGNTAAESDIVQYTCRVTYAGSGEIIPSIRWQSSGGVSITNGIVTTPTENRIDSEYTVTAGTSSIPSCQCEVFIPATDENGPSAAVTVVHVAQNIPTYTDSHSFEEVVVTCKLFSLAIAAVSVTVVQNYTVCQNNKSVLIVVPRI